MSEQNFIILTKELLHEHFYYADGNLFWKNQNKFNHKNMSIPCGSIHHTGYKVVKFLQKQYRIHRLIFLYHHGFLPDFIDHIDTDKANNKIENLRPATKKQNGWNRKLSKNNKSGIKGVSWCNRISKWQAYCKTNGKANFLGYYKNLSEAKDAMSNHRIKVHNEFARTNNEMHNAFHDIEMKK